jgi:hypothetical protein
LRTMTHFLSFPSFLFLLTPDRLGRWRWRWRRRRCYMWLHHCFMSPKKALLKFSIVKNMGKPSQFFFFEVYSSSP